MVSGAALQRRRGGNGRNRDAGPFSPTSKTAWERRPTRRSRPPTTLSVRSQTARRFSSTKSRRRPIQVKAQIPYQALSCTSCCSLLFTCPISMHGCCHDLPCLNEFSGVVLIFVSHFLAGPVERKCRSVEQEDWLRLVHGNCLFKVVGQE